MSLAVSCLAAPKAAVAFRPPAARKQRPMVARRPAATADGAPARETVELTLRKPLGLVLAERKQADGAAQVYVEELVEGGNAAKDGRVRVGDVLTKCSATLLKAGREDVKRQGHGDRLYDNWEQIMFDCQGKQFDTVMTALGSNSERWGIFTVSLEFQRPADA